MLHYAHSYALNKKALRERLFHRCPLFRHVSAKPFLGQRLQAAIFLHVCNRAIYRFQQVVVAFTQRNASFLTRRLRRLPPAYCWFSSPDPTPPDGLPEWRQYGLHADPGIWWDRHHRYGHPRPDILTQPLFIVSAQSDAHFLAFQIRRGFNRAFVTLLHQRLHAGDGIWGGEIVFLLTFVRDSDR